MGTKRMVVDTGIFIEYLRTKNKQDTTLYALSDNMEIIISTITLYELYMGATNKNKKKDIHTLTDGLTILPFDKEATEKSAEIYHQLRTENRMIEFRDIFIAATCITHRLPTRTFNKKHFERIAGLKFA